MMESPGYRTERAGTTETDAANVEGGEGATDASEALLDLLGDEYTRAVLEAVRERPRSGAAVAEATDVSKATAFRRLNDLVEFGIVETQQCLDTDDGHHHKQYRAVIDTFSVTFEKNGIEITIETDRSHRTSSPASPRVPAND